MLQPRYGGGFAEPFVTHYERARRRPLPADRDELYLKRLIVGGLERVYELGKDFRNEGISYKHSPEFTQVEWYEAYADYRDTMERVEELVATVAPDAVGTTQGRRSAATRSTCRRRGERVQASSTRSRSTASGRATRPSCAPKLEEAAASTPSATARWSQLVDHAYSHFVEPTLIQPTIVHDYPIELSPFARTTDGDPTLVERFEYVVGGMEFGNAFSELNDAEEQAQRFAMQEAEREAVRRSPSPATRTTSRRSRTGCRRRAGCGLGIDRLAMVLTGRDAIRDVILFPALRPRE